MIDYTAILSLNYAGAQWSLNGDSYDGLDWLDSTPKPTQAELDADREARMGPTSDSINRTGNRLAEAFAKKVNQHKQRMVAEEIATGNFSFFKK
jgi:hypothetical protein